VLQWRAVAVSWLTDGSSKQRCCCFKRWRERLLLFPSPLVFRFSLSSFVVKWFPSLYSLLFYLFLSQTLPCFKLVFFPLSLSLSLSLSLLFFSSRFLFVSSPLLCWCWVVFIGKRERGRPYRRPIAAHGEQGFPTLPWRRVSWPVGVAGRARLPRFLIMRGRGA